MTESATPNTGILLWPAFTRKDTMIFISVMPVLVLWWNSIIYGARYFTEADVFLSTTVVTFVIMGISWQFHTVVAVILLKRFPDAKDLIKRLALSIALFIIMSGLSVTLLFWGYDHYHFMGYQINETRYQWALVASAVINVFVTFLHEGVSGFDKWKITVQETEQLKKEYMRSQLLGLKSQVSPHYLFNSLNSLSSLIAEDQDKAEKFLDEMSKVYRYLLRNSGEQFVTLDTELQFIKSYFYIHKERYGEALELVTEIDGADLEKSIPPLTLQMILENTLNTNTIGKDIPLVIKIRSTHEGAVTFTNNIRHKVTSELASEDAGLENVYNKYRLLCQKSLLVEDDGKTRVIELPLIES